jgi:Zn-finger nucleic acid-binding protein
MLKKFLKKLLSTSQGTHYRSKNSSDDYHKTGYGNKRKQHNEHGHSYYKRKKRSSGFFSS